MIPAILTDITKCTGCEECVRACQKVNELPPEKFWKWTGKIHDLSSSRFTTIIWKPEKHFVRHQCRHCKDPACVSACLVGALQKSPEGPVIYDADKCMGCRYCMMACPYEIPRYQWDSPVPFIRKCTMCYEHINSGTLREPACTGSCPYGATIYGNREELISVAKKRIADNTGLYIDKIWGLDDVGGTNVLYISDISLDFLGLAKKMSTTPPGAKTWKALTKVPMEFFGMGLLMTGLHWFIRRRMRLMGKKLEEKEAESEKSASAGQDEPQAAEAKKGAESEPEKPAESKEPEKAAEESKPEKE